jgi:6-phospho-3-hexuloisomerase
VSLYQAALDDLGRVFQRLDETAVAAALDEIARARRIALYGVGREGLQIKGSPCGSTIWGFRLRWLAT